MQFWIDVNEWLDTSYVPLWVVCLVIIAYFCAKFIQETRLPPPE